MARPGDALTYTLELHGLRREHLRLSALLAGVLLKTGPVALSKAEAEAVYANPQLHYDTAEDGGITVRVTV